MRPSAASRAGMMNHAKSAVVSHKVFSSAIAPPIGTMEFWRRCTVHANSPAAITLARNAERGGALEADDNGVLHPGGRRSKPGRERFSPLADPVSEQVGPCRQMIRSAETVCVFLHGVQHALVLR